MTSYWGKHLRSCYSTIDVIIVVHCADGFFCSCFVSMRGDLVLPTCGDCIIKIYSIENCWHCELLRSYFFPLDSISRCSSILLLSKSRGFLSSQKRNVVPFHTNCWLNFQDATDPTIGFLLDGIGKLCCLVRKYIAGCSKPVALFECFF